VLEPDRDQIEIFLDALFRYATPGRFLSLRSFFEDRGETYPFYINAIKLNSNFQFLCDVATDAAQRAASATEKVVFAPPIATFKNRQGAAETDIAEGLVLSVECDSRPQASRKKLEQILGPATIVTRSGGLTPDGADKLHLHWRLVEPAADKKTLARLKSARNLAARIVGADPSGKSVVHPYRWPGSWHRKNEPRLAEIATAEPDREIVLEDALTLLEEAAGAAPVDEPAAHTADSNREQRTEWEDAFHQILSGESYHPTLAPLAASFASWGAPEPVTDNVLRCLLINSKPSDPDRLRRRDAELAKLPQTVASAYAKFGKAEEPSKAATWQFHNNADPEPTRWLIKDILPETGAGLISGQWGSYKTTVALDIAVSVMTATLFAGRFRVKRPGGVIYFAVEGSGGLASRLTAAARAQGVHDTLPFAYRSDCPALTSQGAIGKLTEMVEEASKHLRQTFNVAPVLMFIDTLIGAARYAHSGDENDAALAQKVMATLAGLSRRIDALVIGVDHFGKAIETGTRGSSAKEAHADVVIALLADREVGGAITNTRLTLRKQREGLAGLELPFTPKTIEMPKAVKTGTDNDDDDEPTLRVVIEWSGQQAPGKDKSWSKSLRLLQRILITTLTDHGKNIRPFADGPMVQACDLEIVRAEFERQYPAEGNPTQKSNVRRQAFRRVIIAAQEKNLVALRETNGTQFIWLITAEDGRARVCDGDKA
jgi:hypothetical protein